MPLEPLPLTVVIPAYRRPDMVERAIRSVREQTRQPAEVIVVDDASGDETGPRATSLGTTVITHERNQGEGASRNTGLREASHNWVALLDCDDEWLPNHLETLWAERNGHVVVGTPVLGTGPKRRDHRVYGWTGRRRRVLRGPADVALPENKLAPSAVLVRRDAVLAAGGFRDLPRAADLDMWVRLLAHGSAAAIPRVTALYHVHSGQVSTDARPMHEAHQAVLKAHADEPWCTAGLRHRHDGVVAWDAYRAATENGSPFGRATLAFARQLTDPQGAMGVAQLLAWRFRGRRVAARIAAGGMPSVAILPGVHVDPETVPGAVDLRRRTLPGALLRLARRPTSRAFVPGRVMAHVVRALGIEPAEVP